MKIIQGLPRQVQIYFSLGCHFQVNVVEQRFQLLGPQNQTGLSDYGTFNQKRSSRTLCLQLLMIPLHLWLALFTTEGDP